MENGKEKKTCARPLKVIKRKKEKKEEFDR